MTSHEQTADTPARPKLPSSARLIATLGGVATLSGLLIVLVFQSTLPRITLNKRLATERAVFEVLPGATSKMTYAVNKNGFTKLEDEAAPVNKVYVGFDESGGFVGVAVQSSGQGYADTIRLLYGYDPAQHSIVGMKVLDSRETPGLGDKIGKDPDFLTNFAALPVMLSQDEKSVTQTIKGVKHGKKENPWEIDGISGATISSLAVGKMIGESTQQMAPLIQEHLQTLKGGA